MEVGITPFLFSSGGQGRDFNDFRFQNLKKGIFSYKLFFFQISSLLEERQNLVNRGFWPPLPSPTIWTQKKRPSPTLEPNTKHEKKSRIEFHMYNFHHAIAIKKLMLILCSLSCSYELPDTHPLLEGVSYLLHLLIKAMFSPIFSTFINHSTLQWDVREPDDPGKYLLAIWTPGR